MPVRMEGETGGYSRHFPRLSLICGFLFLQRNRTCHQVCSSNVRAGPVLAWQQQAYSGSCKCDCSKENDRTVVIGSGDVIHVADEHRSGGPTNGIGRPR